MTLSRMSPAYALFNRRPNPPQPPDVLAADPPGSQEGAEDTAECPLPAPVAAASEPIVNRPPQKAAAADSQSAPAAQSQILSAFVKQRT